MTSPWPQAESSAATPIGNCPRCGAQRYALLTHHCTTSVAPHTRRLTLDLILAGQRP